jgi:hypothetical protein
MGSYKGQPSNNPAGNPRFEEIRNKRGPKRGVKRGPYKTNKLFRNKDFMMSWNPKIKLVEGEKPYMGAKAYLRTVVQSEGISARDRTQAAGMLLPYEEVRLEGQKLSVRWDKPAPATLEEAMSQLGEIAVKLRLQEITDHDARILREDILALFQPMDRIALANRITLLEVHIGDGKNYAGNAAGVIVTNGLPQLPGTSIAMPENVEMRRDGILDDNAEPSESPGGADTDLQAGHPDNWRSK